MDIAVLGGGAIGSIVAARLAQKGQSVTLIARPDHAAAIRANGLTVRGRGGEETVPLAAAERLERAFDLVIFTVKSQDLEAAYHANEDFLETGWIMTTQNGVQGDNLLSVHFEPQRMISSIVMFGATYTTPGEVIDNFPGDWILGKPFGPVDAKVHEVKDIVSTAFPAVVSTDITGMKWLKLFVNFNNCIPALVGRSMQETFADLDLCRLSVQLLQEGVRVMREANIPLVSLPQFPADRIYGMAAMPEDQAATILQKTLTGLSDKPLYGSILQSILRGKASEIDFINGEIVQLGRSLRSPAELNTRVVDMVHEVEETGRFFTPEDVKARFELVKSGK